MAMVNFFPHRRSIEVVLGTTILQAARLAGVMLESPCNCVGTCFKCTVRLDSESLKNITMKGSRSHSPEEFEAARVLSCQAEILGNIAVELSTGAQTDTLQVLIHGELGVIDLYPCIKKRYSEAEDETGVFALDQLLAKEPGDTRGTDFGIVVDVGTTTLVASLVDLSTGREVAAASALNPQSRHAQDVLSRIRFAAEEAGLITLQAELIGEINRLTAELVGQLDVAAGSIYEMVLSGNTCMLHLATGRNPASLGKYPYTPSLSGGNHVSAARQGLMIAGSGLVYLPPVISGYVGADITSGILATALHRHPGTTLLVDIGTNGEMVLGRRGRLRATSTAAGPAFEGMNISCGMRASHGAVEFFDIAEDATITVKTIGGTKAAGICGSGLLDIVGELVDHGVIGRNGRFVDADEAALPFHLKERLVKRDGRPAFRVAEEVFLSQRDIRQVQLAKGAVRAGIEFLLQDSGIGAGEVDRVLIAGAFGYHLQEKSLLSLGLLPCEFAGKIDFVGNTSKSGGQAFLLNHGFRAEMAAVVKDIEVIELACFPDFDKVFVRCLSF